jgi:hypothetical protein
MNTRIIALFLEIISHNMRGVKKNNLPSKICISCGRPFSWRKKWERDWEKVKYCSKACAGAKDKS